MHMGGVPDDLTNDCHTASRQTTVLIDAQRPNLAVILLDESD